MKKTLTKIGLAVVFSAGLFVGLHSCSSKMDSDLNDETLIGGEDARTLASGYAAIYEDILRTIIQDQKQISKTDFDVDEYSKNFAELYMSRLTPEQSKLLNRVNSSGTRGADQPITVPDEFIDVLKPLMFNENLYLLAEEIDKFYGSEYFLNLDKAEQHELTIQLETLKLTRNTVVILIVESQNEGGSVGTRMSPGDRMIWSEAASQMTEQQLDIAVGLTLGSMGVVLNKVGAAITWGIASIYVLFGW